ncbi:MAG: ATP-binding protein [Christensenellaceae bacterium]|nr:ATP-binding protein [Christensenellaceae bacterium]
MCGSIKVQSALEIRSAVKTVLEDLASNCPITEQCKYDVRLMLSELLANSLRHSCCDHAWVLYACKGGGLRCAVMDAGCGFDHAVTDCPDTLAEGGRGRYLVAATADRLRYNRRGNVALFEYTGKKCEQNV